MSIIQLLESKDLGDFIDGLEPFPDGTMRMRCPIHSNSENNSSFAVFPNNTFYCFSCSAHGGIIHYTMESKGLNFDDAIGYLADYYNLDLSKDEEYTKQKSQLQKYNQWQESYVKDLWKVKEYLYKRGLNDAIIELMGYGYSEKSKALTIPLVDSFGRICGYSYRFFDGSPMKYKNSRNSDTYNKSQFLYNLVNARKLIKKTGKILLVEGYLDAASCQQMGVPAVAYCSSSLTKEHIVEIKKTIEHMGNISVVIAADNDEVGQSKIPKMRDQFSKVAPGVNVRVLSYPDHCKDANDVLINGLDINCLPTEHIDKYIVRQILKKFPEREQQYVEVEKFMRTVNNMLIKADICTMLQQEWQQDIEVIKQQFSVKIETSEEKLNDFADIFSCFTALDEVLDEEEFGIGYSTVDANVTLRKKWVVVLGAYSFSGKTHNLIEWILHWTIRLKKRVLFFSLEMPKSDIAEIIIGKIMGIPQHKIKEVIKSPEGTAIYQKVSQEIQKYLYVVDKNNLSIDDVNDYIKIANTRVFSEPIDVVAVDYYGYLSNTTDYSEDSKTARKMKEIAKDNNVCFVMLSQLNKASQYKGKDGKQPEPSQNDLKGAGDIGASADVIYMIWRPSMMGGLSEIDEEALRYITRMKIVKARKGLKLGQSYFELEFDINTGRLSERKP